MSGTLWIIAIIGGVIAAAIAGSKGRNVPGWFVFGFFFPLIAIIVACVVSDLKAEKQERAHLSAERRRLHEQLRQEKMKSEAFRQHSVRRLDTHDQALGMNTRGGTELPSGVVPPRVGDGDPVGGPPPLPALPSDEAAWFYESGGDVVGPVSRFALRQLIATGDVDPSTLVWSERLDTWTPASSVVDLRVPRRP